MTSTKHVGHRPAGPRSAGRGSGLPWLVGLLAMSIVSPGRGHDMWIEPTRFAPRVDEVVAVQLRLGHRDAIEAFPRRPEHLARFELLTTGAAPRPVPGRPLDDPAGYVRPGVAGLHALVYESRGAISELPAVRFDAYLADEGLESIRAWRRQHGEAAEPGRERYRRSLKSLVVVGDAAPPRDHPSGLPLELVLESPVGAAHTPLRARLLWQGTPLADARVDLQPLTDTGGEERFARTDAEGRVTFPPLGVGAWLLAAVHMERARPEDDWAWDSVFTTLTFAVRPRAAATTASR